ncbi:hypothetical protein NQ024_06110 [Corynebacterium sp. 35RC1]|nr:hypothetical protein [Corynebacterium sp. 35RC1]
MSNATFGLKIGLEGEHEFKHAITEINHEMRALGTKMKEMTSQSGKCATDADAFTARTKCSAGRSKPRRTKSRL